MGAIEVDYLVVGAGAMGMAFVDTLLSETDATVALVDRGDQPGGHWTSAYSFVRLHQPSAYYGVNSCALGTDRIDETGWNAGFYELATGSEVCAYYERVMRQQLLPTGRLAYFPMARYLGDNRFQTLDGAEHTVKVRQRLVIATYLETIVPAMRGVPFPVAQGVDAVAPNELPLLAPGRDHFTIVGAGKTGMDACLWLIRRGISPDRLRWVMPRDSWLLNRANVQPGTEFAKQLRKSFATRAEATFTATSIDDLFTRLEQTNSLLRVDPTVQPTMYHCAIVSEPELEQLRRIEDVLRLGHVREVQQDKIVFDHGAVRAQSSSLYIDCTTGGLPRPPSVPVFDGDCITLQSVRGCQQVFSSALIAHVEGAYSDDDSRNALCEPIPHPDEPIDWLRITMSDNKNQLRWLEDVALTQWLESARLNILQGMFAKIPRDPRVREKAMGLVRAAMVATNERLAELMSS